MSGEAGTFQKYSIKDDIPLKHLVEFVECNGCNNVPNFAPVYQCNNGHLFCIDCFEELSSCPSCGTKMSNVRSLLAEKILDKIPTGCKFKEYGCEVTLPREDLPTHGKECEFREIVCPDRWCDEIISLHQLFEHFENYHWPPSPQVLKPLGEKFFFSMGLSVKAKAVESIWDSQHHFNGLYFFLQVTRFEDSITASGNWYIWIYAGLTEKECPNFICELRISKPGSEESLSKVGSVVSLDVGRVQVIMIHFIGEIQLG